MYWLKTSYPSRQPRLQINRKVFKARFLNHFKKKKMSLQETIAYAPNNQFQTKRITSQIHSIKSFHLLLQI